MLIIKLLLISNSKPRPIGKSIPLGLIRPKAMPTSAVSRS